MGFSNLVTVLSVIAVVNGEATLTTLKLLQILYRHGDRTVVSVYPNDLHADYWTVRGLGQLTNLGMQQQLELGEYIRGRYSSFLNSTYDGREVSVRSTNLDRTLMSAQVNLAGLYPPVGTEVWNDTIRWQPIPVHTVPGYMDYLLKVSDADCPKFVELDDKIAKSTEVQQLFRENKDLLDLVANGTGESMNTLTVISDTHNTIVIEKQHNLSQPSWVTDAVVDGLGHLASLSFVYLSRTNEQMRLNGGPLLKEMLANVNEKINGTVNQKQLFAYSAHDTTVSALLASLGIFNGLIPPVSSAVFVELHRLPNSTYALQFLYRNTTTDEPHVLTVPDCTAPCPLERVIELTRDLIPDDIYQECHASTSVPWTVAIVSGVLTVTLVAILLLGFIHLRKRKRAAAGNYRYTIVTED